MKDTELRKKFKMGREEKNRIGLFVLLVVFIVALSGLVGMVVINSSNSSKSEITKQGLLYEQQKNANSEQANDQQDTSSTVEGEAQLASPDTRVATGSVLVFYSKYPESDRQDSELTSVQRTVYEGQDPLTLAMEELISGPNSAEKAEGFFGGIMLRGDSNCDGKDFKISQDETSVKIQFCRDLDKESGIKNQKEQFIQTFKVLSGLETIYIADKDGKCLFDDSAKSCVQ